MAFPKLNMMSYWVYFCGGVTMLVSFFQMGGAAQSGWTSYPPLAVISPGQTLWLFGMVFLITSSLLGALNFIVTIVQLRAKGLTWMRLPFFVWAQFVTSFLLLLAFPPLEAAGVLQLMDRLALHREAQRQNVRARDAYGLQHRKAQVGGCHRAGGRVLAAVIAGADHLPAA